MILFQEFLTLSVQYFKVEEVVTSGDASLFFLCRSMFLKQRLAQLSQNNIGLA